MRHIVWIILLAAAVLPCRADYFWLSNDGLRLPQDSLAYPFSTGDTIQGDVHCNGPLALSGHPVFYGQVSISAPAFIQGPNFDPEFRGPPPIYDAPQVGIPSQLNGIRQCAATQGGFYVEPGKSWRVRLHGSTLTINKWDTGTPFDSTIAIPRMISSRMCLFFDGPLEIYGHMNGQLTIASSHSINFLDNVVCDDANVTRQGGGRVPMSSWNILGVASEADIKISNTPANGRENSDGQGFEQQNLNHSSIFVTASLLAVGGFTFEQQNDPDSGYVCDCVPDERGTLYLFGTLTQGHCGHLQQLYFDSRMSRMLPPCWPTLPDNRSSPLRTDFGSAPVSLDISPNPFNLTTSLRYALSKASAVKITLYDILGRAAKEMDLGAVEPGEHSVQLTANDLASGVYFVRLSVGDEISLRGQAGHQTVMKKVVFLK